MTYRAIGTAIAFAVFTTTQAHAGPSDGPNSFYTGNSNEYSSEAPKAVRRTHKARYPYRDVQATWWSRAQGGSQVASLGSFAGKVSNGVVRSSSGATAKVNPAHAAKFQCLVNKLEASGYRIRFIGGYRHSKIAGTNRWSKHASGRAIDINQTARNRCVGGCPRISGLASSCGLTDGKNWRHADAGHFEVP